MQISLFMTISTKKLQNRIGSFSKNTQFLDWHKHPFAVPVVTFMVLFFVSIASFIFLNGETIGANDSKVVRLFVDGQTRIVPTRVSTVGELLEKNDIEVRTGDRVEPAIDSQIVSQDFNVNVYRAKPVTIIDSKGQKVTTKVIDSQPAEMATEAGVKLYPEDNVSIAAPDEALKDGVLGANVVIDRATPTSINLYGETIPVRTHSKTVGDLLKEKDIKTLEGDTVQPAPETPVTDDTRIFITRFGKQIANSEEAIPAPTEEVGDPNMTAGTTTVKTEGAAGRKLVTYEIELQNGKEVSRKVIQEVIAAEPIKKVVLKGTKVVISNPSANVEIGQRLAAERGWTGEQWYCLYQLWQKESKWNHLSANRSSGAYGIPQALPGSKMASVASDWQTNPETQIKWGLGYIAKGSYKTPCAAWQHSQARGWY